MWLEQAALVEVRRLLPRYGTSDPIPFFHFCCCEDKALRELTNLFQRLAVSSFKLSMASSA